MAYVDAIHDRKSDLIRVVERVNESRQVKEYPVEFSFYYEDFHRGKHKSIFNTPLSKVVAPNRKELQKEIGLSRNKKLYETDINPIFACLANNYTGVDAPKLHVAFFDIETDMQTYAYDSRFKVKIKDKKTDEIKEICVFELGFNMHELTATHTVYDDKTKKWVMIAGCKYLEPGAGYSSAEDALMPITAIAVYLQWLETLVCLSVPPATLTMEEAQEEVKDFPNTILFETEKEMLDAFLNLIDDSDVLSGWNSDSYDIPYTVNRVIKVLSKNDARRFCLFDEYPKRRVFERFGKEMVTYDLIGRNHLDSLELYRKFTYEERHNYKLDSIAAFELGENKVPYEGNLDQLYNNDYRKFIEYNRQDCLLLDKLDKKLRFIDLANQLAHQNTVLLQTTLGAVAIIDQAIVNEAHRLDKRVPSRKHKDNDTQAAGAYVAYPKKGMHKWVGSLDINSLYPSVIRALNMGAETIVGQLRSTETDALISEKMTKQKMTFAAAWEGMFSTLEYQWVMDKDISKEIIVDWEDGKSTVSSGAEIFRAIFESNKPWALSANGTIFSLEHEGIVPGLLTRWYAERKSMQKIAKSFINLKYGIELPDSLTGDQTAAHSPVTLRKLDWDTLDEIIHKGDKEKFDLFVNEYGLKVSENKLYGIDKELVDDAADYWDLLQQVKKVMLNSLYGASLNAGSRFFDKRFGQSTTLTGRQIVKHMSAKVNEIITGKYDYRGEAIYYNDTDSEVGSTVHITNFGKKTIEELFQECSNFWANGNKEYGANPDLQVLSYNADSGTPFLGNINYIYRHKVSKDLYEIKDMLDNTIIVTEDHSVMIEREGVLQEVKPNNIIESDILISVIAEVEEFTVIKDKIKSVTLLRKADNEYVYDIGMKNEEQPWYFGNNILIHNSVYFSAYNTLKEDITHGLIPWSKEDVIHLYDGIEEVINDSFPEFMNKSFHCTEERGKIIRAGRELVCENALFITKKRYAALYIDKDGKRVDINGEVGKVKAMGLDLRRSDTPKFIQDFLSDILMMVLTGSTEEDVLQFIIKFREEFRKLEPWEIGSPKRANNVTTYSDKIKNGEKSTTPGHVTASINWNNLRKMYSDNYAIPIIDGSKVIVCKLRANPLNITSVAYPVDELRLPHWFKELPFDFNEMEDIVLNKKLQNLLGVLGWDLESTHNKNTFSNLFDFE